MPPADRPAVPLLTDEHLAAFARDGWVLVPGAFAAADLADADAALERLPRWPGGAGTPGALARISFEEDGNSFWGSALSRRAFMMGLGPAEKGDPGDRLWGRRGSRPAPAPGRLGAALSPLLAPGTSSSSAVARAYPGFPGGADGRWTLGPAVSAVIFLDDAEQSWRLIPRSHDDAAEIRALQAKAGLERSEGLFDELLPSGLAEPVSIAGRRGALLLMHGDLLRRECGQAAGARAELRADFGGTSVVSAPAAPAAPSRSLYRRVVQFGKLRVYHPLSRRLHSPPSSVNVGAGRGWSHPRCAALDVDPEVQISHNLSTEPRLPFDDAGLKAVYSSHCIEHLTDADARAFFAEAFRCLADGGVFRLTCPDMDLVLDAYDRRDLRWFDWRNDFFTWDGWLRMALRPSITLIVDRYSDDELRELYFSHGREGLLERFAREQAGIDRDVISSWPNSHKSWWTPRRLIAALREAGFPDVRSAARNESRWPDFRDPRFFDYSSPPMSLYVEAVK